MLESKRIFRDEEQHVANGVDVRFLNRNRVAPANMAALKNYPLYDIYVAINRTRSMKKKKALVDYAMQSYGYDCVSRFFARCERMNATQSTAAFEQMIEDVDRKISDKAIRAIPDTASFGLRRQVIREAVQ